MTALPPETPWLEAHVRSLARLVVALERTRPHGGAETRHYEVDDLANWDIDPDMTIELDCGHGVTPEDTKVFFVDPELGDSSCLRCVLQEVERGRAEVRAEDLLSHACCADRMLPVPILERSLDLLRRQTDPKASRKERFRALREEFGTDNL